ncbi:FAD-dependent pyridine nucleotide-disulfide oxidoreductase, partial [mine drainage metagenome]
HGGAGYSAPVGPDPSPRSRSTWRPRSARSRASWGSFRATLRAADGTLTEVGCGAAIIATGFDHFDPGRETQAYGYYEYEDVITLVDAERMLQAKNFVRPSTGEPPQQV